MVRTLQQPGDGLWRYLTNSGKYPWSPVLHTPTGDVQPTLLSYHDLLTVNEVFCRHDYGDGDVRTAVDIGANVGLAALFFLTRRPDTHVWCFEPDPYNLARLRTTLADFGSRVTVVPKAVTASPTGPLHFEPGGRYGKISPTGDIEVQTVDIATALREVAADTDRIDLVKIDVEGLEEQLLSAIPDDLPICKIVYEDNKGHTRWVSRERRRESTDPNAT
jgi:FkbM family methyltransferase